MPANIKIVRTFAPEPTEWLRGSKISKYSYRLLRWLSVPDLGIWWLPFAIWAGMRLLRQHHINAIYATGDPFSAFIIGVILKKFSGLPLIIDFRDPWTLYPYRLPREWHVFWREPIERMLEAICIRYADKVLCISAHAMLLFETQYSQAIMQKFTIVNNGFDPEDLDCPNQGDNFVEFSFAGKITLAYIGTTTGYRTPHTFLEGVRILLQNRPELRVRLQCLFVGNNQRVDLPGLNGVVHWIKYVSHPQVVNLITQADILVLLTGGSLHELPGKLFEYIATGGPILALAPLEGAVAEILRQVGLGKIVSPTDPEEVAIGLGELVDDLQAGIKPTPQWATIDQYSRRNTTGQLATILNEILAKTDKDLSKNTIQSF